VLEKYVEKAKMVEMNKACEPYVSRVLGGGGAVCVFPKIQTNRDRELSAEKVIKANDSTELSRWNTLPFPCSH
jgi:hypothetical protein